MKLAPFFEAIAPYLVGGAGHDETVALLYGEARPRDPRLALDAERLAIYERFVRLHRAEALTVYHRTRAEVVRRGGEEAWLALVEEFFRGRPMRRFEINDNGEALPGWLAAQAEAHRQPPWLAELADLDWWCWRAETGPDGEGDPARGPLRIAPEVEVRPYRHELLAWLEQEPRAAAPPPRAEGAPLLVVFWRDRDLDGRHAELAPRELAVLKMVSEGIGRAAVAAATGLPLAAIDETLEDLHAAGILVGEREQERVHAPA